MSIFVELSNHAEVWRCAACDHVCLFDELFEPDWRDGPMFACPRCRSVDVFPALDGEWPKEKPKSVLRLIVGGNNE